MSRSFLPNVFLLTSPGLEKTVAYEVNRHPRLGLSNPHIGVGGVEYSCPSMRDLASLCLQLRTPDDVLLRINTFPAKTFLDIENGFKATPFGQFIRKNSSVGISVSSEDNTTVPCSFQTIVQCVKKVLEGRFGVRAFSHNEQTPDSKTINLRLCEDCIKVSLFATKDLYKRNAPDQPKFICDASLRETTASSILEAIRQDDPRSSLFSYSQITPPLLWDPFCGSGTFLTEYLLSTLPICNDASRLSMLDFPCFPLNLLDRIKQEIYENEFVSPPYATLIASDCSPRSIFTTRQNRDYIINGPNKKHFENISFEIIEGDFEKVAFCIPPSSSHEITIISNLPYGSRTPILLSSFQRLGQLLSRRTDIKNIYVVCRETQFERRTQLKWRKILSFSNRGISVSLLKLKR